MSRVIILQHIFFLPQTFIIVRYIHKENYFQYIYGNLRHASMIFIIALNFLFELQKTSKLLYVHWKYIWKGKRLTDICIVLPTAAKEFLIFFCKSSLKML